MPVEFSDYDGTVIRYEYSRANFPTKIVPVNAPGAAPTSPIELEYDALRRMTKATTGGISHSFVYDSLSRFVEEVGLDNLRIDYTANGREQTISYPDGRQDLIENDEPGKTSVGNSQEHWHY